MAPEGESDAAFLKKKKSRTHAFFQSECQAMTSKVPLIISEVMATLPVALRAEKGWPKTFSLSEPAAGDSAYFKHTLVGKVSLEMLLQGSPMCGGSSAQSSSQQGQPQAESLNPCCRNCTSPAHTLLPVLVLGAPGSV